jgi:cytochrome c biogenesis protein CcmG, thiol:disulfide interchange protein DsbE
MPRAPAARPTMVWASIQKAKRLLVSLGLVASLVSLRCAPRAVFPGGPVPNHPLLGKPAPEIVADPVGGEGPKTLADARGKIVVLDFWATYCAPCRRSFPKYQALADKFPDDVVVLAVSVDDVESTRRQQLIDVAKATGVKFAIVWDKGAHYLKTYGALGVPATYLLDRTGTVRYVQVGETEAHEDPLAEKVNQLLGEARPPTRWEWLLTEPPACGARPADDACATCRKTSCCTLHGDAYLGCLKNYCPDACREEIPKVEAAVNEQKGRPR